MRKAHQFFNDHKTHILAVISLSVIVIHYIYPELESAATAITAALCVECS